MDQNAALSRVVNPNKVALVCAVVLAGWHALWAVLVFLGVAQAIYDFILWAHMIHLALTIGPFEPLAAVTLIVLTSIIGYLIGYFGAIVWNRVYR